MELTAGVALGVGKALEKLSRLKKGWFIASLQLILLTGSIAKSFFRRSTA